MWNRTMIYLHVCYEVDSILHLGDLYCLHIVFSFCFCFRVRRVDCFIRLNNVLIQSVIHFITLHWLQSLLALRFLLCERNYGTQHSPQILSISCQHIYCWQRHDCQGLAFNRCSPRFCPRPFPNLPLPVGDHTLKFHVINYCFIPVKYSHTDTKISVKKLTSSDSRPSDIFTGYCRINISLIHKVSFLGEERFGVVDHAWK